MENKKLLLSYFLVAIIFLLSLVFIINIQLEYLGIFAKGSFEYTNQLPTFNSLENWQKFGMLKMGFALCENENLMSLMGDCKIFVSYPPFWLSIPYIIKNIFFLNIEYKVLTDLILIFYYFISCLLIFLIFFTISKLLKINHLSSVLISLLPFVHLYLNDFLLSNFIGLWVPEASEFLFIIILIYSRILLIKSKTNLKLLFYIFAIIINCLTSNIIYFIIIFDLFFSYLMNDKFNLKTYFIIIFVLIICKIAHFITINPDQSNGIENNIFEKVFIGLKLFFLRVQSLIYQKNSTGFDYNAIDIYNRIIMNKSIKLLISIFIIFSILRLFLSKNLFYSKTLVYTFIVPCFSFFLFALFADAHHVNHDFMLMRFLIISASFYANFLLVLYLLIIKIPDQRKRGLAIYGFNVFVILITIMITYKEINQINNFNFLI